MKNTFFEGPSWFKVNYLGLALDMALKSHAHVAKELKLKVRKCWGLTPKLVEGAFCPLPRIQNRVNLKRKAQRYIYICTT